MNITTPLQLYNMIQNDNVLLIDVREPFEHQNAHIENDYLLPLQDVSIENLPSTDKPIVFYCKAGVRSLNACYKIADQNPNLEIYSLQGGLMAWQQMGYETRK